MKLLTCVIASASALDFYFCLLCCVVLSFVFVPFCFVLALGKIHPSQGWRIEMEDSHTIIPDCAGLEGHSFVAVYDGHGGASCAKYAGESMMRHIMETSEFKAYAEATEKDTEVCRTTVSLFAPAFPLFAPVFFFLHCVCVRFTAL